MTTYISLLRGINVSGHNIIKMDALKQMYSDLGFKNVLTYIQSGNVIFQYKRSKPEHLENKIATKISEVFDFNVPVLVLEISDIANVLKNNPFIIKRNEDRSKLHATLLSKEPGKENTVKINTGQYLPDEFNITGRAIYLFCPDGYGRTKLTNTFFENKLKISATTRNWKTMIKLYSLAENLKHDM
jgi:uncharacterized protein (DUF1697 family)